MDRCRIAHSNGGFSPEEVDGGSCTWIVGFVINRDCLCCMTSSLDCV